MENQSEQISQEKAKAKKKSKIQKVFELHQKEVSVKDIAKKMKLSEHVVRSYIWRKKNPEKYKELLKRYFEKRKASQSSAEPQNETTEKTASEDQTA